VISSSPTDLQPVMDAFVSSAARLPRGHNVQLFLARGQALELMAAHGAFRAIQAAPDLA
jgi:hypothetical protein